MALGPPGIGLVLIGIVIFDDGTSEITRSPAVAAAALVVGGLLILGSGILYAWNPEAFLNYSEIYTGFKSNSDNGSPAPADENSN